MSVSFEPAEGFISVSVDLVGPTGYTSARFALDTGATRSLVNREIAVMLGYDPTSSVNSSRVMTGSGVEIMPRINVDIIEALELERRDFPILCHTLPPGSPIDGLLGVDFFREQVLIIDFRAGLVTLE